MFFLLVYPVLCNCLLLFGVHDIRQGLIFVVEVAYTTQHLFQTLKETYIFYNISETRCRTHFYIIIIERRELDLSLHNNIILEDIDLNKGSLYSTTSKEKI